MPNGSETGNQCQTADRLHRLSCAIRDTPMTDRTAGIVDSLAILMQLVMETSPDDQAEFCAALAKVMRRG